MTFCVAIASLPASSNTATTASLNAEFYMNLHFAFVRSDSYMMSDEAITWGHRELQCEEWKQRS